MHPRFVAEECLLFFARFSKKGKQRIAEIDLTFCTEANQKKIKKENNGKQELKGKEVAKESLEPALEKEAKQY